MRTVGDRTKRWSSIWLSEMTVIAGGTLAFGVTGGSRSGSLGAIFHAGGVTMAGPGRSAAPTPSLQRSAGVGRSSALRRPAQTKRSGKCDGANDMEEDPEPSVRGSSVVANVCNSMIYCESIGRNSGLFRGSVERDPIARLPTAGRRVTILTTDLAAGTARRSGLEVGQHVSVRKRAGATHMRAPPKGRMESVAAGCRDEASGSKARGRPREACAGSSQGQTETMSPDRPKDRRGGRARPPRGRSARRRVKARITQERAKQGSRSGRSEVYSTGLGRPAILCCRCCHSGCSGSK